MQMGFSCPCAAPLRIFAEDRPFTWHATRLQTLRPDVRRVLREYLLEHARDASVRWGIAHGLPRAFIGELGAAEADGEGMPLLLVWTAIWIRPEEQ